MTKLLTPTLLLALALTAGTAAAQTSAKPAAKAATATQPVIFDMAKLMTMNIDQVRAQLGKATNPFDKAVEPTKADGMGGRLPLFWTNMFDLPMGYFKVSFEPSTRRITSMAMSFLEFSSPDQQVLRQATNTVAKNPKYEVDVSTAVSENYSVVSLSSVD